MASHDTARQDTTPHDTAVDRAASLHRIDPTTLPGRPCSVAAALDVVGDRWALLIVREVLLGNTRFSQIARNTGAPRDRLSARLRALVDAGVLDRHVYQESPRREEYRLTESGRELSAGHAGAPRLGRPVGGHRSPGAARPPSRPPATNGNGLYGVWRGRGSSGRDAGESDAGLGRLWSGRRSALVTVRSGRLAGERPERTADAHTRRRCGRHRWLFRRPIGPSRSRRDVPGSLEPGPKRCRRPV